MKTLFLAMSFILFLSQAEAALREEPKVVLPPQYSAEQSWPLVVLLHGYASNSDLINAYFGLGKAVNRGFILVVPNGHTNRERNQFWNASPACCDFEHENHDDVGYLLEVVNVMKSKFNIDENRIFAVGHSNGGFMAHRLACDIRSPFSAIVSLAGVIAGTNCRAPKPVSVLQIHAVDDDTIKFEGDKVGFPNLQPYPGVKETMNVWAKKNTCGKASIAPKTIDLVSSIPGADTSVTSWQNCRENSRVELWTIKAYSAPGHSAHSPGLGKEFTSRILDFLLGAKANL